MQIFELTTEIFFNYLGTASSGLGFMALITEAVDEFLEAAQKAMNKAVPQIPASEIKDLPSISDDN